MSKQIRLRRQQDRHFQRTDVLQEADIIPLQTAALICGKRSMSMSPTAVVTEETERAPASSSSQPVLMPAMQNNGVYVCQRCKNHNQLVYKRVSL